MSELQMIEGTLKRATRRRQWECAWRGMWLGLLSGSVLWLLVLGAYKVFPFDFQWVIRAGLLALAFIPIGGIAGWFRKPSLHDTARWVDGRQHLKERLSTAWEFTHSTKKDSGRWTDLVVRDAAAAAGKVDVKRLLPWQLPRASRWALLVLALGVGLGFIPEYRTEAYRQKELETAVVKDVGREMTKVIKRELARKPPVTEPVKENVENLLDLGDELSQAKLTRTDALKEVSKMSDRLKEDMRELSNEPAFRRMQQAARQPSGSQLQEAANLQKRIESLQKSLEKVKGSPEELEQLKRDLEALKQAAANMASNEGSNAEQADQLAQSLASMQQRAANLGVSLPTLEAALNALQQSDIDQFLKDLDIASEDLEELAEMAKTLKKLQQTASKMGENLAEQLKFGQAEAARSTLEEMVRKLQSRSLNQEEMAKMMEEVKKALEPAGEYGEVAKHLEQALQQMQGDNQQAGAQSLQNAADELKRLMDQMAEAEMMMANLKALLKAQQCLGNCQGWGNQLGPPRAGPGGKPGRGVGTWADENGWGVLPQITERWDNTGIERPDMDPRGQTDRGEGELADTLSPTKLSGKFSQGGPMPSITLKGVSIKGESRVEFSESNLTGQSGDQGAMNQEQIPRAYQGAVRDYFDEQ